MNPDKPKGFYDYLPDSAWQLMPEGLVGRLDIISIFQKIVSENTLPEKGLPDEVMAIKLYWTGIAFLKLQRDNLQVARLGNVMWELLQNKSIVTGIMDVARGEDQYDLQTQPFHLEYGDGQGILTTLIPVRSEPATPKSFSSNPAEIKDLQLFRTIDEVESKKVEIKKVIAAVFISRCAIYDSAQTPDVFMEKIISSIPSCIMQLSEGRIDRGKVDYITEELLDLFYDSQAHKNPNLESDAVEDLIHTANCMLNAGHN